MSATFDEVFAALREILKRHTGTLNVTKDTAKDFCLEGGLHPTHTKPMPVAWITIGKNYVSFHHMGAACPNVLTGISKELKARMQGKACFNFSAVDPALFAELEELTVRGFDAFRNAPWMRTGRESGE